MLHLYITLDERKKNKDVSNLKYNQLIHMMKKKCWIHTIVSSNKDVAVFFGDTSIHAFFAVFQNNIHEPIYGL